MDLLLATHSIGISDLREAPARAFEQAGDQAVVVLNHNKPAGYILSTRMMEHVLELLADRVVTDKARDRLDSVSTARRISLDDL